MNKTFALIRSLASLIIREHRPCARQILDRGVDTSALLITRKVWRYSLADFDSATELPDSPDWGSLLPDIYRSWRFAFPIVRSRLRGALLG